MALMAEIFKFRKVLAYLVPLGILVAYCANFYEWNHPINITQFGGMLQFKSLELSFSGVILATAFFWFIIANNYFEEETSLSDHFALVCFALAGAIMMVSFMNMVMLFLGIEILSIPLYVMAASRKKDVSSNEAGFKYFLMGSFASGFLLFGIALVYGATGTFDIPNMASIVASAQTIPSFFYVGVLMMLVAMCFKVAAAPFHFWSPDVYQGSPTLVTAFMSTVVKTAAMAAFIRLFSVFASNNVAGSWTTILAVISGASLLIANFTAATQQSVKRMLAYSSISHAGFMLMAIVSNTTNSFSAILYYTMAYSFGSIAVFAILNTVARAQDGDETFSAFHGLGKRNPFVAACMVIALLSLSGIPITSGFFAKYFVLSGLFGKGFSWLIITAILCSAVGVYYYFKLIIAMYFREPKKAEAISFEPVHLVAIAITTAFTIALGLFPESILRMIA